MCENVSSHFQFLAKQNLNEIDVLSEKLAEVYQTHIPEYHVTSMVKELHNRRCKELEHLTLSLTTEAAAKLENSQQQFGRDVAKRDIAIQDISHTNELLKRENADLSNAVQKANRMLIKSKDIIQSHQQKLEKSKERAVRVTKERSQAKELVRKYSQNLVDLERLVSKRTEELREQSSDQKHRIDMLENDLKRATELTTSLQQRLNKELERAKHFEKEDSAKTLAIVEYKVFIENGKMQLRERDALVKDIREKLSEAESQREAIREEQLSLSAKVVSLNGEKVKLEASEKEMTYRLEKTNSDYKSVQEELFYEKRLSADRKIARRGAPTARINSDVGGGGEQDCTQQ